MLCQIPELEFLSKHIEHLDLVDLLAFALPVYEELSTIDKRLGVLEGGGILSHARIYYYAKQVGRLVCLEDESALDFIESHVCDIMSRVASDGSLDLAYRSAVGDWCSDILRQIAQVRPLQGGALAGGFFGCRPLRAINDTNHDCAPSAPVC